MAILFLIEEKLALNGEFALIGTGIIFVGIFSFTVWRIFILGRFLGKKRGLKQFLLALLPSLIFPFGFISLGIGYLVGRIAAKRSH